jgi:hypothetical protein
LYRLRRGTSVRLGEDGQAAMARQRDLQEGLTDEMVELVGLVQLWNSVDPLNSVDPWRLKASGFKP